MAEAAVVVVADAPRAGACRRGLEPLLGPEGCARLQAALVQRALAWAVRVGAPHLAFAPADARDEVTGLVPEGCVLLAQDAGPLGARLAQATDAVLAEREGPVLLLGAGTPQLRPVVGLRALEDLADGCDATFGPATDGGYYLVGLGEAHPEIFDLPTGAWTGPDVFARTLEAAHGAGLQLGMLRAERSLDEEGDVRALLADPLAPRDIVEVLRALGR